MIERAEPYICTDDAYEPPLFKNLTIDNLKDIDEAAGLILAQTGYGEINLVLENCVEKTITYRVSRMVKRQNLE